MARCFRANPLLRPEHTYGAFGVRKPGFRTHCPSVVAVRQVPFDQITGRADPFVAGLFVLDSHCGHRASLPGLAGFPQRTLLYRDHL